VMPLFFLSGALFPLEGLPTALTVITRVNPLTYGVDALRATLSSASHFSLGLDFGVLGAFTLFFLLLGSWLFSRIEA